MRRPIKPFSVEVRRSSRKTTSQGPAEALEEGSSAPEPEVAPARRQAEDQDQTYLAALRAADALFGSAPTKSETRPSWPTPAQSPQPQSRSPATLAAEQMFRPAPSQPSSEPSESSAAGPPATGRILPSLNEPDPLQERMADAEAAESEAAPRTSRRHDPLRSRSSEVRRIPIPEAAPALETTSSGDAPAEHKESAEPQAVRVPGYVRGSIYARWVTGKSARPGERWKKRRTKSVS